MTNFRSARHVLHGVQNFYKWITLSPNLSFPQVCLTLTFAQIEFYFVFLEFSPLLGFVWRQGQIKSQILEEDQCDKGANEQNIGEPM